jgi:hypothetical protein
MIFRNLSTTLLLTAMLAACGGDDGGGEDEGGAEGGATHAEALTALSGTTSACAIASCHGTTAEANLQLSGATNLRDLLVNVKACEAPTLNLVEPGNPSKSWLWIKLTAKTSDSRGTLEPQSAWGSAGTDCDGAGFGTKMPQVGGNMWNQADLETIESWIKGGAPGPT